MPAGGIIAATWLACEGLPEHSSSSGDPNQPHGETGTDGEGERGTSGAPSGPLSRCGTLLGGRGSVAGWDAGRNDWRISPPRRRGRGLFVNAHREAANIGGLARDLPPERGVQRSAGVKRGGKTSGTTKRSGTPRAGEGITSHNAM